MLVLRAIVCVCVCAYACVCVCVRAYACVFKGVCLGWRERPSVTNIHHTWSVLIAGRKCPWPSCFLIGRSPRVLNEHWA